MIDLRGAVDTLPEPDMRYCTPQWAAREKQIRQSIKTGRLDQFLRWKPCRLSLVKLVADIELAYLRSQPDWSSRWSVAVQESNVGAMPRSRNCPSSSGILLRHAALIAWLQNCSGLDITHYTFILEFGAGYGSMCRLAHRLGFQGTYIIYDLPALVLLQQHYLRQNGITGVRSTWDFDSLPAFIAEYPAEKSLFIATWSLSEAPYSVRNALLSVIGDFRSILIASQTKVRDMDNVAYFDRWESYLSDMRWYQRRLRKEIWLAATR